MKIPIYHLEDLRLHRPEILNGILMRGRSDVRHLIPDMEAIVRDIDLNGDEAVVRHLETSEGVRIGVDRLRIGTGEFEEARSTLDCNVVESLDALAASISSFHEAQIPERLWSREIAPGFTAGQMTVPLRSVGCVVPPGAPTAVLMTACPARVVGVGTIVVSTPAGADGSVDPATLVACQIAGATDVFRSGWAVGAAAMALGTATIPKVDKIVGLTNPKVRAMFAALGPRVATGTVNGPSEGLVLADDSACPEHLAYDFVLQAEHGPDSSCVLVTAHPEIAREVQELVPDIVSELPEGRRGMTRASLEANGVIVLTESLSQAIEFANEYAPSHLEIVVRDPMSCLSQVRNAAAVYLGHMSPISTGCFAAGPNHVLPTGGRAAIEGGLSTAHYLKTVNFSSFSPEGLTGLGEHVRRMAEYEGFPAHAQAIAVRHPVEAKRT